MTVMGSFRFMGIPGWWVQGLACRFVTRHASRFSSLFREAPAAFLRMIVVHELAHLKERGHDKAFYALCTHMEPDCHQLEFDARLWLTGVETGALQAVARRRR